MNAMLWASPDANVSGYATLIKAINLPDSDDRHILAAAIRCKVDVVVTANLKDFPKEYPDQFGIEAQHPDKFITDVIRLNPETALQAFKKPGIIFEKPSTHRFTGT